MIEFIIKEQLPSLNEYINKLKAPNGVHIGSKFKSDYDTICATYALTKRLALREYCKHPVIILFCWNEQTKRRDLDNVYSGKKYILDALQKVGILENDNYKHLKGVYDCIGYGQNCYVRVRIYRLNEFNQMWNDYSDFERVRLSRECEEWEKKLK